MANKYKRDFFTEAHQLLKQQGYRSYIQTLLPGGKWQGNEYIVLNPTRNDNEARSLSINGTTSKWADFATDKAGNDLIGLTSYIKGLSPLEACYHIGVLRLGEDNFKQTKVQKPIHKTLLISQEIIEPTGGVLAQEPPPITATDTRYHNERTFYCFPSAFFPYRNSLGVTVGYMVRWDVQTEGGKTEKHIRPYIYDVKAKKYVSKFFGQIPQNSRPLYNLPQILERKDATVLIVEGEKTAEAAKILFPEFVATTSSGGAQAVTKTKWHWLRGRDIIIAPDDGNAGNDYLERIIKTLAKEGVDNVRILEPRTLGNYVIKDGACIERTESLPKGYDLADSLAEGWTAELIQQVQLDKRFYPFFKEKRGQVIIKEELKQNDELYEISGKTYKLTPTGLYTQYFVQATAEDLAKDPKHGETDYVVAMKEAWQPLCSYLKPTHRISDAENSRGILVKFKDIDNIDREVFLKRTDWLGEKGAIEVLQDQGLQLKGLFKKNFALINEYLDQFTPDIKAVGVETVGWQGNNDVYMLPFTDDPRNHYVAKHKDQEKNTSQYILQQKGACPRTLTKRGTLQEWERTVGQVCRGNHLHTFAILASLAAPALKLLNEEGGFFHYVGGTSIGKSTILHVAKSVWGFDNLGVFSSTSNALESICKNSNDGVLFLDEIGQVDADALGLIIYMLTNGMTKSRANQSGEAKAVTFFKVLAQSTGEIGLEAKLAEKNKSVHGGQIVRMVELNADRQKGLNTFDILNINPDTGGVFKSGAEQAEYLKEHASKNSGVVIDEFLKQVVPNIDDYKESLKTAKAEWLKNKLTGTEGVEIVRVAKRFSTIFASAIIAQGTGILPFSTREIDECTNAMFDNWLERFGGDSPHELKTMIADLHKLTIENQYSRFQNAHPTEEERDNLPRDKAGYWQMGEDEEGNKVLKEFWILPQVFEREILKGKDKKTFYPLLVKGGYIEQGCDGKNTRLRRPARQDSQRFIVVPIAAFDEEIV